MQPKVIAFYLPQYHEIPENNKWWGKGFTDWVNVKKAKPLFIGHYQPREPLNDNYYDLSDVNVMKWQAKLAKKCGIYGFCYYHYWFHGKLLLEKPLENMLRDKDVDIPFCLSWANEPWARTWDGKDTDILMPQEYGGKEDWKKHFEYLVKFFKDDRYIKINNKPMLLIYRTGNIPNVNEMVNYWRELAINYSFDGIYLAETLNGFQDKVFVKNSSAVVEFEPNYTLRIYNKNKIKYIFHRIRNKYYKLRSKSPTLIMDYDLMWKMILNKEPAKFGNRKTFIGGYVGWDNTPRKKEKGAVHINFDIDKFKRYFQQLVNKAAIYKSDFIFINAWNEWAEGAYLEPDKKYKYKILEIIRDSLKELKDLD